MRKRFFECTAGLHVQAYTPLRHGLARLGELRVLAVNGFLSRAWQMQVERKTRRP